MTTNTNPRPLTLHRHPRVANGGRVILPAYWRSSALAFYRDLREKDVNRGIARLAVFGLVAQFDNINTHNTGGSR